MKSLTNNLTIKEFNDLLKEGIEQGIIISSKENLNLIKEIYDNLRYYFIFFKELSEIKNEI